MMDSRPLKVAVTVTTAWLLLRLWRAQAQSKARSEALAYQRFAARTAANLARRLAARAVLPPAEPCPICFSESRSFALDCGCAACFACLRQHAATEVRQGRHPRCPMCLAAPGTSAAGAAADRGRMSRSQVELLLSEEDMLVLDRRQLEAELGIFSCPHCRSGLELGPGVDLARARCPACRRALLVDDAAAEASFRAYSQQRKLQRCPRCSAAVERSEGCNHMRCRCGAEFCYKCGTDTTASGPRHWAAARGGWQGCPQSDS